MKSRRTALILSGGGLYGAWQVGAWCALEGFFQPDIVIGCSIGSLNGWAIAGGSSGSELGARWDTAMERGVLRWRLPANPLDGLLDFGQMEAWIRQLHTAYRPKIEYYAVITELRRLKPELVEGKAVTWRHLAASCALLGLLPQQRIGHAVYTDGGLLAALPLWAARVCGATHTIALQVMPRVPWPVRAALKPLRRMSGLDNHTGPNMVVLEPSRPLGSWRHSLQYDRSRIRDWMDRGAADVRAAYPAIEALLRNACAPDDGRTADLG